jgi:hypothetical protein
MYEKSTRVKNRLTMFGIRGILNIKNIFRKKRFAGMMFRCIRRSRRSGSPKSDACPGNPPIFISGEKVYV